MITKVLIANRGEIACRIIKSVQAAGYSAVAIHSDVDADALFTTLADEKVALGGNTAAESYLDMDKVIAATKASGANAIHPGYGFLSENAAFSALCKENQIIFIGPSANAIEVMGNKAAAKELMLSSDVPCIPGYQGKAQDDKALAKEAKKIGFPLMVKAAAGGGGRGIRLVADEKGLIDALASARKEAINAFGSDEIILEKAVIGARHIEIQVAADRNGHVIHVAERDCSAQRRHQKVIEEAPSPFVTPELREAMGVAAVNAAKAVDYEGVGTIEFLVDADSKFYFLEMNTRLQVEHPVTEMITGVDLVEWQLKIANGEDLPLQQDAININGHSIEVRIYAEDPSSGFMPQTGVLRTFEPALGEGVRIDHGVYSGALVSPFYDSMLAKLIAWGKDREEARGRLLRALKNTKVLGLTTNKTFLIQLLEEKDFISGEATTAFIDEEVLARAEQPVANFDLALAGLVLDQSRDIKTGRDHGELSGWSNSDAVLRNETLQVGELKFSVKTSKFNTNDNFGGKAYGYHVIVSAEGADDEYVGFDEFSCDGELLVYRKDGVSRQAACSLQGDHLSIDLGDRVVNFTRATYHVAAAKDEAGSGNITASTEGLIIDVLVKPGDKVSKGDALVVVEAMKMEHRHLADGDGEVVSVNVENAQQVKLRQLLVELKLDGAEETSEDKDGGEK